MLISDRLLVTIQFLTLYHVSSIHAFVIQISVKASQNVRTDVKQFLID